MLNGTLTLHDIRDVEAFTAAFLHRRGLTPDEDLHAWLIEETWILSTRYDGSKGSRFSAWAKLTLERRLIDRGRKEYGDHRYQTGRNRPTLHPLDETLTASPLDHPEHRDPDLIRHLTHRDRTQDRPYPTRHRRPTRAAA